MRCAVLGAGAWGLPAAAELARRGHEVVLVDRHGPGTLLGSSAGPTRIWRMTHPDAVRVRLARRSIEAWHRLESDAGITAILRRGLLWRDDESADQVVAALTSEGVAHTVVEPGDVGRFFPGLRPDGRVAIWQEDAGPVLSSVALEAQAALFGRAGGRVEVGPLVREIDTSGEDVVLRAHDGREFRADAVVLAPGPGAAPLLDQLGHPVALAPQLAQVCHVGHPPATDALPCLYDGPRRDEPGLYAMPTPGQGYKLGLDRALRAWREDDLDRTPDPAMSREISARVASGFADLDPTVRDAQVCSWTYSPDGMFIIDRVADGRVVVAAGDSGEGFKFSALMGTLLADLTEGQPIDEDLATFGLARFAGDAEPGGPASG